MDPGVDLGVDPGVDPRVDPEVDPCHTDSRLPGRITGVQRERPRLTGDPSQAGNAIGDFV